MKVLLSCTLLQVALAGTSELIPVPAAACTPAGAPSCTSQISYATDIGFWDTGDPTVAPDGYTYKRQCPTCEEVYMLCVTPDAGPWNHAGNGRLIANLMLEKLNARQVIPGVELMCDWHNGNCNSDVALRTTVNRLTVGPLAGRYIAGMSFCGGEALGLWKGMQMTNGNMLAFHPGARNPEYAEYGGMFRVGQTENVNLIMWPQMLKDAGFTRVAVMSGKTVKWGGNHGMMVDVLSQMVDSGELEEVYDVKMDVASLEQVMGYLQTVYQEKRMKRIIMLGYGSDLAKLICAQWVLKMPDAFYMIPHFTMPTGVVSTLENDVVSVCSGVADPPTAEDIKKLLKGRIVAYDGADWQVDTSTQLTCAGGTLADFSADLEDVMQAMRPDNPSYRGGTSYIADASCAAAMVVKEFLARGGTLSEMLDRSDATYEELLDIVFSIEFEGVSGPVSYSRTTGNAPRVPAFLGQLVTEDTFAYIGKYDHAAGKNVYQAGATCDSAMEEVTSKKAFMHLAACASPVFPPDSETESFPECSEGQTLVWGECKGCDAGTYYDGLVKSCRSCQAGTYSAAGATQCQPCAQGSMSAAGATDCTICESGTHAPEPGMSECLPCPAGTYTGVKGSGQCFACPLNTYATGLENATSQCTDCPATFSTLAGGRKALTDCTCAQGSFWNRRDDRCELCPSVDAFCPGGLYLPLVYEDFYGVYAGDVGYAGEYDSGDGWAVQKKAEFKFVAPEGAFYKLDVFRCTPGFCPAVEGAMTFDLTDFGGQVEQKNGVRVPKPLAGFCPASRTGRSCEQCESGSYGTGVTCTECSDGVKYGVIVLLPLMMPVLVYGLYRGTTTAETVRFQASFVLAATFGLAAFVFQTFAVFSSFAVNWPAWLKDVFELSMIIMFDIDYIGGACLHSGSFGTKYIMTMLCPMFMVLATGVMLAVSRSLDFRMKMHVDQTFSMLGMCFSALYVSIVKMVISWFECAANPSRDRSGTPDTLATYPDIICWEGDHMAGASVAGVFIGLSLYIVAFFSMNVYAATQLPNRINDTSFRARFKFAFNRWRNDTYYWGVCMLTRNLLVALAGVISNEPRVQLVYIVGIMQFAIIGTAFFTPWRHRLLSIYDFSSGALVCFLGLAGILFASLGDEIAVYEKYDLPGGVEEGKKNLYDVFSACILVLFVVFVLMFVGLIIWCLAVMKPGAVAQLASKQHEKQKRLFTTFEAQASSSNYAAKGKMFVFADLTGDYELEMFEKVLSLIEKQNVGPDDTQKAVVEA